MVKKEKRKNESVNREAEIENAISSLPRVFY